MIIGIVGFMGSGKDTVAKEFVKNGCIQDSFAAPLKDAVSAIFGWERLLLEGDTVESRDFRETPDLFWSKKLKIDHFTPRLALQLLGTDCLRHYFDKNIWLNSLEYRILKQHKNRNCIVVSDARFKNELELIRQMKGKVIWVKRGPLPEWYDIALSANSGNAVSRNIMNTRYKEVHESEWNWIGFGADYIVENDSTLENLFTVVRNVYTEIFTSPLALVK